MSVRTEVDDLLSWQVARTYARQSHLIDSGEAGGWAATFTPEGEFDSPSYPKPVRGRQALEAFAREYARNGEATGVVSRHVVTSIDVLPGNDDDTVRVRAYLQIIATPFGEGSRLVRMTAITDDLVRDRSAVAGWLIACRRVSRDDAGLPTPTTATGRIR